jgi:hypothetical protein
MGGGGAFKNGRGEEVGVACLEETVMGRWLTRYWRMAVWRLGQRAKRLLHLILRLTAPNSSISEGESRRPNDVLV